MRVLILSITAGTGHNVTAEALSGYFSQIGVESQVFDTYKYINKALAEFVDKSYLISTKDMPKLYKVFYRSIETRKLPGERDYKSLIRVASEVMAIKIRHFISEYKPDVIVCTHVLAGIIMDVLKSDGKIKLPVLSVLTDFVFHPFWEESQSLDYIIIPNELMVTQAYKKGFRHSQILPFGIPINPIFNENKNKNEVRKELGLCEDVLTILYMSGGMGFGNIANTLRELDGLNVDCQIIAVCGKNKKAQKTIEGMSLKKNVLILGFVDYVSKLMDASDCIITKPGGLTTAEALAKTLPIIIVNPIPGQEERNTEFLLNNGVAMAASKTCPLDDVLHQFFCYPEKIENMRNNISLLRRPNATKDICEFIKNEYYKTSRKITPPK